MYKPTTPVCLFILFYLFMLSFFVLNPAISFIYVCVCVSFSHCTNDFSPKASIRSGLREFHGTYIKLNIYFPHGIDEPTIRKVYNYNTILKNNKTYKHIYKYVFLVLFLNAYEL